MPRTRIKICGITRPEDATTAAGLGADAIGLNFVGGPRRIEPKLGRQMILELTPLVTPVALVSGHDKDNPEPHDIYNSMRVNLFQLYGPAPHWRFYENECAYWIVRSIGSRDAMVQLTAQWLTWGSSVSTELPDWRVPLLDYSQKPSGILLDTASPDKLGGTGKSFNWHWIAEARAAGELEGLPPIILAGGLTPDNVAEAIRIARPYAVDVSSGVEVAGKAGIKDPIKMRDFIQAAQGA
jgi:phosphoribosylanthranilate isomerase